MNCVRCGVRLEANARFCQHCGLPAAASQPQNGSISPSGGQGTDETVHISPLAHQLHTEGQGTDETVPISPLAHQLQRPTTYPQQYYSQQPQASPQAGYRQSEFAQFLPAAQPQNFYQDRGMERGSTPRRRNRLGCVLGCLGTLLVVILLLGVTWVFALRPYIHNLAMTQMDEAMTNAVNQIPPIGVPIPPGTTVPIAQSTLNNVLAQNPADTDIVQDTNIQITASQVVLDFEVYGQDCTITSIPQMQSGNLVATNVTISGIASLVLSPQDVTDMLDSHLKDIQTHIDHRVTNVHLVDQEIDVTFA